jgi:SAM-dependent methyltransferase
MDPKLRWRAAYEGQAPPESLPGGLRQYNGYRQARLYGLLQSGLQALTADWAGRRVLDLGCGTGDTNGFLAARNQVWGADFSLQMLSYARQQYPALAQADAEALPFADGSFEALIATGLWQCLAPQNRLLHEARRVLRPGGDLVLGWVLNADYPLYWRGVQFRLDPSVSLSLWSWGDLRAAAQAAGFEFVRARAALFPVGNIGQVGGPWRYAAPAFSVRWRRGD